jgi:hypothetical protein
MRANGQPAFGPYFEGGLRSRADGSTKTPIQAPNLHETQTNSAQLKPHWNAKKHLSGTPSHW